MDGNDSLVCFLFAAIGHGIGYWIADGTGMIIGFFVGAALAGIL